MALGGAWVRTVLGQNMVVFEGRTFGANDDTAVLGLDGDAGSDTGFQMPAGFPKTHELPVPTDAVRHRLTRVKVLAVTSGLITGPPLNSVGFSIEPTSAPWRKTIRMSGGPDAPVALRVEVEYPHTMIR